MLGPHTKVVADAAPADGHGVAFGGIARAEDEVFGKECEAVVGEVLLHVKGFQFGIHNRFLFFLLVVVLSWLVAAAGKKYQQQGSDPYCL